MVILVLLQNSSPAPVIPLLLFGLIVWSIARSPRKLFTLLVVLVAMTATLLVIYCISLFMPYGAGVLGIAAVPLTLLFGAWFGIMDSRRRLKRIASNVTR